MEDQKTILIDEEQKLFNHLVKEYGVLVNVKQTSRITRKSETTLYRDRKKGIGINYIQNASNAVVWYPLHEIVRYLCATKTQIGAYNENQ